MCVKYIYFVFQRIVISGRIPTLWLRLLLLLHIIYSRLVTGRGGRIFLPILHSRPHILGSKDDSLNGCRQTYNFRLTVLVEDERLSVFCTKKLTSRTTRLDSLRSFFSSIPSSTNVPPRCRPINFAHKVHETRLVSKWLQGRRSFIIIIMTTTAKKAGTEDKRKTEFMTAG